MPDGSQISLAPPTRATALPSIEALARHRLALDRADDAATDQGMRCDRLGQRAWGTASLRRDALDDLVIGLPPHSLTDAAVQVERAMCIVDQMMPCHTDEDAKEVRADLLKVQRVLAGILPVIVAEGGVNTEGLFDGWALRQREEHFGLLEAALAERLA